MQNSESEAQESAKLAQTHCKILDCILRGFVMRSLRHYLLLFLLLLLLLIIIIILLFFPLHTKCTTKVSLALPYTAKKKHLVVPETNYYLSLP